MKKRTIERKSKDGFLTSVAKNLGLKAKEEPKAETREFDDLIETLRTGECADKFRLINFRYLHKQITSLIGDVFHGSEKYKRSRKTKGGSSPPRGNHSNNDSNSRERIY